MKNLIYITLFSITILFSTSFAQINVSGDVSGTWNADTVFVDGNISVPLNQTLTIEPGTIVYFTGEYEFNVYGTLIAEGTETDSIFFASDFHEIDTWPYYAGFWYGIVFHSTDENGQTPSSLNYCNLKYAYPVWLEEMTNRYGGGLVFYKSQINVSNTTFTDCQDDDLTRGVFSAIYSEGNINGLSFLKTDSFDYKAGTLTLLSSEVTVDNLFMYEAYGVYIDSSNVEINNSNLDNCSPYAQHGSVNAVNSEVGMTNCEITNNNGIGILSKFSQFTIEYTLIKNNSAEGGLFIESPSTFTNCEIIGNSSSGLSFQSEVNWGTTFTSEINNCVIAKNNLSGIRFLSRNNANITNCTIADNTNSSGWGGLITGEVDTHLKNCIVYNNGNTLDFQAGGLYTYSIIQGNYVGSDTATTNLENVDPLFRDAANGDYHLQSIDCGYNADSPAIDAGSPAISDFVLDCASAGLETGLSDIGAYGGANNWWDKTVLPICHYQGDVSGVWDCDTVYVYGDVTIPEGDTLIITESVKKVLFKGKYEMVVNGVLLAIGPENEENGNGLEGDYIRFTGSQIINEDNTITNTWQGITFNNTNNNGAGTSIIENCLFEYARSNRNGIGAIYINNSNNVIIKNSLFYRNIGFVGGAIFINSSNPTISHCSFYNNGYHETIIYANAGGAIHMESSSPIMNNIRFVGNKSYGAGGALYLNNSSPQLRNVLFVKNSTIAKGGAVGLEYESSPKFINATIADNTAGTLGGAFYFYQNSNAEIINSIMYRNTKPEIYTEGEIANVTYSLIDSASSQSFFGEGCLDENPQFKMTTENHYYLSSTSCGDGVNSPAIDAGHPDSLDAVLDCTEGLGTTRADMGFYGGRFSPLVVGVDDENQNGMPTKYNLAQNYPNPFNPTTTIKYSIPSVIARSGATRQSADLLVQLKVYDILGREVATLVNQKQVPGNYSVKFDASKLTSGIYFYRLQSGSFVVTKKMILMK
jgi:hypothetical protein